jgi:hypothetical protein
MHYVTNANYLDGHRIWLEFNDKKQGVVDLTVTMEQDHRPIFRELTSEEKFKNFRLEADTIVWENGLDLAPEFLYQKLGETKNNGEFFDKMNS